MPPAPIKIEAPRVGIQFNPSSVGSGCIKNFRNVDGIGLALEKKPARKMTQAGDVGVFDSADDAIGHFLFIGGESGMDRGHDVIQFLEKRVGKIEFPLFENVTLRSG